jgi:hypothetical protein
MPAVIAGSPEEGEYGRSVHIYRFDDVVWSVQIRIAYYLNVGSAVVFLFNHDGSHILENVAVQDSLNNH